MKSCSILGKGDTVCKNKSTHSLIFDNDLYSVCESCYKKIFDSIKFSAPPEDVKVRVFRHRKWTEKELAMLGSYKDDFIARKLGISVSSVSIKRRELGIPFLKVEKSRERNWTDKELKLLGTMPDRELAKILNVSTTTVGNKRRQLKLKSFDRPKRDWTEDELGLLGVMPDREVAEKLDLPYHTVYEKRRKLNIPAMSKRKYEDSKPKRVPRLKKEDREVAHEIYNLYDNSKTLVDAVTNIKSYIDSIRNANLGKVATYLTAKNPDNFPLERCLSLVGIHSNN